MRPIDKILSKSARVTPEKAVEASASEKRFAPRRDISLPAIIHVDNSDATIPCFVKDMSATGARLMLRENWYSRFQAPPDKGDHIRLVLRVDQTNYHCKVMRREETELGVTFVAPAAAGEKSPPSHTRRRKIS